MSEEKYLLWDDAYVGMEFPSVTYELTQETVSKYAEAVEDDNPLYRDEAMAAQSEFGGLIAPPTIAAIFVLDAINRSAKRAPGGVHAKQEFEFLAPARPGDILTTTAKIIDKYLKKERRYTIFETETRNARGELVVRGKMTTIWAR